MRERGIPLSLLTVEGLYKSYGDLQILRNISLNLEEGERHVIIGPNGAGKTTLFNCITGTIPINAGVVKVADSVTSTLPNHRLVHLGLSRTFQQNNLFQNLTVEENIHLAIASRKPYRFQMFKPISNYKDLNEETLKLLEEWDILNRSHIKVNELSYGEQRLLEVILSMASNPKILLLDEPTSGMSPAETKQTSELIQSLPRSVSLLIIEHDMEVVFSIADKITVLHHGEMILSGTPEEIRGNELVKEIYFGGGAVSHAQA